MIFTYPAIVTKNVDRRYLPAAIKSIELYLLHHIVESVASGSLRFKITQNILTRKFSELRLESTDQDGMEFLDLLTEAGGQQNAPDQLTSPMFPGGVTYANPPSPTYSSGHGTTGFNTPMTPTTDVNEMIKQVERRIQEIQTRYGNAASNINKEVTDYQNEYLSKFNDRGEPLYKNDKNQASDINGIALTSKDYENAAIAKEQYEKGMREKDDLSRALNDLAKQRSILIQMKKDRDFTGGANVRIDTTMVTDLRPTAVSVEADIMVKKFDKFILPTMDKTITKMIPISVKVIPIYIEDFTDISQLLLNDMYTNQFSKLYRTFVRSSASVFLRWFKPVLHKVYDISMPGDVNIWRDMILSKKGLVDASTFSGKLMHGKYKKYAASIIVMSVNDIRKNEENWFSKPHRVNQLFSMGWNSFAVMDDPAKKMTFCCEYDDGLCNVLPYNYMFKALMASDLYKELDDLNKFTAPMMRGLKSPKSLLATLEKDKKGSLEVEQHHEPRGLKQSAADRVKSLLSKFTG